MNADYTYDRDTDQFVVTLDDGTEVCRTRAPHTAPDKVLAADITAAIVDGEIRHMNDGSWDTSLCPRWLQLGMASVKWNSDLTSPVPGVKHAT